MKAAIPAAVSTDVQSSSSGGAINMIEAKKPGLDSSLIEEFVKLVQASAVANKLDLAASVTTALAEQSGKKISKISVQRQFDEMFAKKKKKLADGECPWELIKSQAA